MKDILFLLPPGFIGAGGRREFCPECAEMWGVLSYFPAVKDALDIRHVEIVHPRAAIIDVLGEGTFNAPTLVLTGGYVPAEPVVVKTANGFNYIDSARGAALYFAQRYGLPVPRGSALSQR